MNKAQILKEIKDAIKSVGATYSSKSAAYDAFEAYIWTLLIDACRRVNASVTLKPVSKKGASKLYFRTAPRAIYSDPNDYSHANILLPGGCELEAHVGIKVQGASGAVHECDVCLVDKTEADYCRSERTHPRHTKVPIAIECKYYSSAVGVDRGRSFLGLAKELAPRNRYFVCVTHSPVVEQLLRRHELVAETQLGSISLNNKAANRFRSLLEHALRRLG